MKSNKNLTGICKQNLKDFVNKTVDDQIEEPIRKLGLTSIEALILNQVSTSILWPILYASWMSTVGVIKNAG